MWVPGHGSGPKAGAEEATEQERRRSQASATTSRLDSEWQSTDRLALTSSLQTATEKRPKLARTIWRTESASPSLPSQSRFSLSSSQA